jgi:fermentation-respiration switch protein FrsA (DUF1100 family)
LTSVKEQAAGVYAAAMAELGYVALAFDHRTFGESGGIPRQFENPYAKAEDISAALDALLAMPELVGLPVIGLGVCAGGGYMAQAVAKDRRISVFAGVAGVYNDAAQVKASMGGSYVAAKARAQTALERFEATGEAETIPAVAADSDDVAMPLAEAFTYYGTSRGQVPNYVNGFAVQSRLYTLDFDVQSLAPSLTPPTILVHSEHALAPAWARSFFAGLRTPKRQLWLDSQGQIDFYDDPRLIGAATDAIDNFAREHRAAGSI